MPTRGVPASCRRALKSPSDPAIATAATTAPPTVSTARRQRQDRQRDALVAAGVRAAQRLGRLDGRRFFDHLGRCGLFTRRR